MLQKLRDCRVRLELHSKEEDGGLLGFARHFVLDGLEQGDVVLVGIELIDLFQMLGRRLGDELEEAYDKFDPPTMMSTSLTAKDYWQQKMELPSAT